MVIKKQIAHIKTQQQKEIPQEKNQQEYIGHTYYFSFKETMRKNEKNLFLMEVENANAVELTKTNGKSAIIFVPSISDESKLLNRVKEMEGTIVSQKLENTQDNIQFITGIVVQVIKTRLAEINHALLFAEGHAQRITKFKNITRAYIELREFAEFYSNILQFSTNKLNSIINTKLVETKKFQDMVHPM